MLADRSLESDINEFIRISGFGREGNLRADLSIFSNATSRVTASPIRQLFDLMDRPDVISFAGGFPPKEALDIDGLCKATSTAMRQSSVVSFQYGATGGYEPLRELLVHREKSKGIAIGREDLIVTSGSQQAIDLVCRVLVNPGEKVVVEAPTYLGALLAMRFQGAEIVAISADDEGIDVAELRRVAEKERPKLLYVIPNFANPTGRVTSLRRRKELLEIAKEFGFYLVEDDAYGELYFNEPPPPSLLALADDEERKWVVHISSMSKILSPGMRLAWMTGPSELLRHVTVAKQLGDAHAPVLSQTIAFHYLNSGALEPALTRTRRFYRSQALAMSKAIRAEFDEQIFRFSAPEGGMFFWAQLEGADTERMLPEAIASGVAFVPGAAFYANTPIRDRVRLSFATASVDQISRGIKRLASLIERSF
ncbi:GntR family transcriptional regulator [Paraburkholderia hospita]|uniref:GntR family transcriptional regulator n=1 Tax=Paraburkholderia hospita TaxID=169430 RepID=A0ABN0FTQ2_9BURK|nr:PLP-dependent aminotransferase family protein [Paraburkholderia hospita]EIN02205.1 GntR family transcriptional regulator [Paraburkholderia hospita]OUL90164.1 GntR family transcriptional regulator [Paraburkholderia hospita]